ncbi:MAG: glycosyltransferase [Actinomycetota bacterium]|nr:glycosyltransferase [Actinomycetota bacterium]
MPDVSVVISTLGNYEGLARVLKGYEHQDAPEGSFEVLVVADCADPEPHRVDALLVDRPYPVRRLTGNRRGLSANRNTGTAASEAPLVLFTDNDTIPSPQLVSEHLAWHRENPEEEVGVVGHVRWAREIKVTPFMHWLDHGVQFDYPNIHGTEAGWGRFYGANSSAKRSFVERVGGYDEVRLPYLYEDLDFGYRASKLGFRVLYNRRAEVEHLREMDLEFWQQKVGRLARVERTFVAKHPEIPPYFYELFSKAAALPPARGRGKGLIRLVPRAFPWLGPRVWTSADLYYRQGLAPGFLEAWDSDEPPEPAEGPVAPYLLDSVHSGGSSPSGPK